MPFRYEFYVDDVKLDNVEMGFSTSIKWEEALDEARLIIPFSYLNKTPYKMFSLLTIMISEYDSYANVSPTETRESYYLIYSDKVEAVGAYGYYKHTVSAIEYTAKLDAYMVAYLAQSRSIVDETPATFELNTDIILDVAGTENTFETRAWVEGIDVKATYRANEVINFPQVERAYWKTTGYPAGFDRANAVITTNAPLVSGASPHILSNDNAEWVFPKGHWYIEYGFTVDYYNVYFTEGYHFMYRYYINVIDEQELSIYDVVNEIRTCVSKFGGIEDTVYFDSTRIFDIDPNYETYLKSVQAPQIYLERTTARKMLVYVLAFVNALPRLEWTDEFDILTIEPYNLSTGTFTKLDVIANASVQNTSQIGTRNYQHISQSLANDLDEPSIYAPSQSSYQQVRSTDIQITANNFSLKLPKEFPLYMPKHLYVLIPHLDVQMVTGGSSYTFISLTNLRLDLMPRLINGEYWKLKDLTANFPDIDTTSIWDENIGMRLNMVSNLAWNMGDTEINLSQVFGQVFQSNLITNVVKEALYEYYISHIPKPMTPSDLYGTVYQVNITLPSNTNYKDWRFRLEYITDERLVIKQDKEDLSQISFYSEMQQNQEEALVNVLRQSRKGYGDLQRTGNVENTFAKLHTTFSDFYEIGQTDTDNYTITQIDTVWFNDYALARYHVTKYHNRIQQATYVNQKYRPFDNFAKSVLNRHENYTDYLIAYPPNNLPANLNFQSTKIYSNANTIRTIVGIMLGEDVTDERMKASVAVVRTDGMLDINQESIANPNRYLILAPVTAKGIKGGFAFTFGFSSNQSAGDGLVAKTSSLGIVNYFNQTVRYTDLEGRFTRFGFAILKDYDYSDYKTYPLITEDSDDVYTKFSSNALFWCGYATENEPFERPLVWNKDPLTNANLTYQLSVVSYYMGLYVFGIDFYSKNYIVNNPEIIAGIYTGDTFLYRYTNGEYYNMFEDIYVKSGYLSSSLLYPDTIVYDEANNWLKFTELIDLTGITSWAIGRPQNDGTIRLLLACNEGLNGVQFIAQHFRPNVTEIGAGNRPQIYVISLSDTLSVISNISVTDFAFPHVALTSLIGLQDTLVAYKSTDFVITLSDTLDVISNISIEVSTAVSTTLTSLIELEDTITVIKSTDFVIQLTDYLAVISTLDVQALAFVEVVLTSSIQLQDSIDVIKSTDFVINLSDTITVSSTISATPLQIVTVTFESNGGSYVDYQELEYDTTATEPNNPTYTGYDFDGWYSDSGLTTPFVFTTPITEDMTLYAGWIYAPLAPTISFDSKTGTSLSFYITNNSPYTCTVYYEQSDSTPDANSVSLGSGATSGLLTISGLMEGTSYTVYARAQISSYISDVDSFTETTYLYHTVNFYDYNETLISTQEVLNGGNATAPSNPTRTGYTFTGWSVSYTNITIDTDVYAEYTILTFTVSFNEGGGTLVDDQIVEYGGYATEPLSPVKKEYTFLGWYLSGGMFTFDFDEPVTSDRTAYAQWQKNKTSEPTINTPYFTTTWRYTITNNDASTVDIVSDYDGTIPPATLRGIIASGGTTAVINTGYAIGGFTIYATAQSSLELVSEIVSVYVG